MECEGEITMVEIRKYFFFKSGIIRALVGPMVLLESFSIFFYPNLKIISGGFAERIKPVINGIIHFDQKGRYIVEAVRSIYDTIEYAKSIHFGESRSRLTS